jgi:hypothetical protein
VTEVSAILVERMTLRVLIGARWKTVSWADWDRAAKRGRTRS